MTVNKTSIPRIKSVTFKNGGAKIHVLPKPGAGDRARLDGRIASMLDAFFKDCSLGGFAFVVWDPEGRSNTDLDNAHGNIPSAMIPDFVRNLLLAAKIECWTGERYGLVPGNPDG